MIATVNCHGCNTRIEIPETSKAQASRDEVETSMFCGCGVELVATTTAAWAIIAVYPDGTERAVAQQ